MSTLYRGGTVLTPGHPGAGALVVDGGLVAWVGTEADAARHVGAVEEVVELGGALVAPAFVDAHAHLSQTGAVLRGVDIASAPTLAVALSRLEDAARAQAGRPLYAPNWDEARWPEGRPATAGELDRATYGGVVYMPRVDGHSAVISSALAAASGARQQPGWRADGLVTREAHHLAREAFTSAITPSQRRDDIDLALRSAAAAGIGLVHENGGRILSSADDFADVLAAGQRGDLPQTIGYWAQLVSDEREARDVAALHHAHGLAGDLNIDGSIGSRTASLHAPYADAPDHRGNAYLTVEQVRDHIAACSLAGLQGGFHVIGDAGAEAAVAGIEAAAALVGADAVRSARHRLEHLEMVGPEGIARLAALGVTASVQPAFDALWGGGAGMYAVRLGPERAGTMNRFAAMAAAGMTVALGSDSPVTPFEPWEAVRAWAWHHSPEERVPVSLAFDAHTRGGWRAAGVDGRGVLAPGLPATFAVWAVPEPDPTTGLPALRPGDAAPATLRTVVRGRTVHDAGALS